MVGLFALEKILKIYYYLCILIYLFYKKGGAICTLNITMNILILINYFITKTPII